MSEEERLSRIFHPIAIIIIIAIVIIIVLFSIGPVRYSIADSKILAFAEEKGITNTSYEIDEVHETLEGAMRELYNIAVWEKTTYESIDNAFDLKYDRETYSRKKDPGAFAAAEKVEKYVMSERWIELRHEVEQ